MKVLIRADSSSVLGVGHVMRCLTLAQQLAVAGAEVTFACRDLPGNLFSRVLDQGFLLIRLSGQYPEETSAFLPLNWHAEFSELHSQLDTNMTYDCLIVDHYGLDWHWEHAMRQHARCIFVIDDLCNRHHDADVLLDQNLSANIYLYKKLNKIDCRFLLGPEYALVRPEFIGDPIAIKPIVKSILVNFGGADPTKEMFKVMDALDSQTDVEVVFVAGFNNPEWFRLEQRACGHSNWRLVKHVDDFASYMRQSDLFIGAAGSTCWERATLGLPSISIAVASNQEENAFILGQRNVHVYLGYYLNVNSEGILSAYLSVKNDQKQRAYFQNESIKLCQNGLELVADIIMGCVNDWE